MPAPTVLSDPPMECDVAVVGAGIVGLATALELAGRHPSMRVAVLERGEAIAGHQTSHSSGVVHAGIYYEPGSLKARLCVAGMAELYDYCERQGIEAKRSGKLIVATDETELQALDELERRGQENGVPGLARIGPDEIQELEPHARGLAALHSPMTGVVDFTRVAASYAEELEHLGGTISVGCGVAAIADASNGRRGAVVDHVQGRMRAGAVIVCAGAWTDRLAVAAGAPKDPRIVPFRGAYLRLRHERAHLVRGNIYAVPDPELPFLAPHLTRTIDGDVLLGPTAMMVAARDAYRPTRVIGRDLRDTFTWPGTWRLAGRHWRTGLTEIRHASSKRAFVAAAQRLVPELSAADFVPGLAGIRAQALDRDGSLVDDFVVSKTERALFVRNAPSPAATSSLPLARLIADEAESLLGADAS